MVWERGQQHRSPGAAALQVALDDQPAQGMADQHGRFDESGRGLVHVLEVVVDAVPDPAWRIVVAAKPHGFDLVAAAAQPLGDAVPAPGPVPGPMHQQDPGHPMVLLGQSAHHRGRGHEGEQGRAPHISRCRRRWLGLPAFARGSSTSASRAA